MPKSAIALRHVGFEDLGSLAPVLSAFGYKVTMLDVGCDDDAGSIDSGCRPAVVTGGPIGVRWTLSIPLDEGP